MKPKEISSFYTQETILVTQWSNALRSQGIRHSLAIAHCLRPQRGRKSVIAILQVVTLLRGRYHRGAVMVPEV